MGERRTAQDAGVRFGPRRLNMWKGMEKYLKNMALLSKWYVYRPIAAKSYTRPWAIMALDTLRKAATLAPETKSSALLPYSAAAEDMF